MYIYFLIQSLPLHTLCLFPILLNKYVADTENPDGICSLTFLIDEFSESFSYPSFMICINNK